MGSVRLIDKINITVYGMFSGGFLVKFLESGSERYFAVAVVSFFALLTLLFINDIIGFYRTLRRNFT